MENHGKEFKSVVKEIGLYQAYDLLKYDVRQRILYNGDEQCKVKIIGRIDLGFIYKGKKYLCEVKYYPFNNGEFWDAIKILGYTVYYKWQVDDSYYPSIMIPIDKFKLEHAIVANNLNITVFCIEKNGDNYSVKLMKEPLHK